MIKQLIWPILKPIAQYTGLVITGYIIAETWVIKKADTVVEPLRKEMMIYRSTDKEHWNQRFDDLQRMNTDSFNKLEKLIKETK